MPTSRKSILAAWEIMNISSDQPCYILVSNLLDCRIRLPKHMKIIETADPPSIIRAIDTDNREASLIGTLELSSNFQFNAPHSKINSQASQQIDMSAVHLQATESRDFEIS